MFASTTGNSIDSSGHAHLPSPVHTRDENPPSLSPRPQPPSPGHSDSIVEMGSFSPSGHSCFIVPTAKYPDLRSQSPGYTDSTVDMGNVNPPSSAHNIVDYTSVSPSPVSSENYVTPPDRSLTQIERTVSPGISVTVPHDMG